VPFRIFIADAVGMQKNPIQSEFFHLLIELRVTVFFITRYRMPGIGGVHTDLVRSTGHELNFNQCR
jgi:hypothetical protein